MPGVSLGGMLAATVAGLGLYLLPAAVLLVAAAATSRWPDRARP